MGTQAVQLVALRLEMYGTVLLGEEDAASEESDRTCDVSVWTGTRRRLSLRVAVS